MAISSIGLYGSDDTDSAIGGGYSVGGNIVACDNNKGMQCGGTSNNAPGGIARSAINIWYGLTHKLQTSKSFIKPIPTINTNR